jgi:translocation and assembly module TamB
MSWRRRLAIVFGAAVALLLVIVGTLTWVLGSVRGTAWLVGALASRTAPAITVGRVEGTLLEGVELGDVTIVVNADRIEASDVEVELAWASLLERAVVIERFRASTVSYSRGRAGGTRGQLRLPELPFTVEIRSAELDSLTIESDQDRLVFTDLALGAELADGRLVLEQIATDLQGAELNGRIAIDTRKGTRLDADVDWRMPREPMPASGRLTIGGMLPELDLRHELAAPFVVSAAGKLWVESPPRVALEIEWPQIAIPGREDLGSVRGLATLEGPIDALRFSSNGALTTLEYELEYEALGTIDGPVVRVEPLTVSGPGGSVAVVGEIAIDTLDWSVSIDGRGLDPGAYDARWPGSLDIAAQLRGRLRPTLQARAESASLSGTLRGFPFAATVAGMYEFPNRWQLDRFEIAGDGDVARARGTIDERLDLTVEGRVERLERWWPEITGSIAADLSATGEIRAPRIEGAVEAREIELRGYRVEAAKLEGGIVAAPRGAIDVVLTAANVTGRGLDMADARVGVDGTVDAHGIDFALESSDWSADAAAHGGFDTGVWSGSLESARIRETALGEWRLKSAVGLEVGRGTVVLAPACLAQSGTDVCAELRLRGGTDDEIALAATNFDVAALQPFLPDNVELSGLYELSVAVTDLRGAQLGHVALTGGATHVRFTLSEREVLDREIESVALRADLEAGRLDLELAVDGGEIGRIDLGASVTDVRDPRSGVDGRLALTWRDLEPLSLLSPDVGNVVGDVNAELELGGTLTEPELQGSAQLSEGAFEIPAWALRVDAISGTAVTVDGTLLEYSGSGYVDGQVLYVTGTTQLDPARNWPTRLRIRGDAIRVVQRADAEVLASPDLEIDVALPEITVQGTVEVPQAVIALEQLPAQAVRPSVDAIVHGVERAAPARPLRVRADARLTLGDDVRYNAAGLLTQVDGELGLHYESGLTPSAAGSLRLTGTYNAYGQTLELERGELLFTGPLDDPAIDVRAQREIGETTVGVQLTGALKSPSTRIYSEPAMSEADALSYLLLGRPLLGTGEQETATLESAAVAMGLQQALPAIQRIGTTLGLDELSIQTTDEDSGALTAGKYLSPRLYVRYSYGLFSRIGGLLVRFDVNERLGVETRSGDEDSVDLLYTVEKD